MVSLPNRFYYGIIRGVQYIMSDCKNSDFTIDSYLSVGRLRWHDNKALDEHARLDANGIPEVYYHGHWAKNNIDLGWKKQPSTVAFYGLEHHSRFVSNGCQNSRSIVISMANYLCESQDSEGAWRFEFEAMYYDGVLSHGWCSCLTQGVAISLLLRANNLLPSRSYQDSIKKAVDFFELTVENGGCARIIKSGTVYEEYPVRGKTSFVLNGHCFALVGLYEAAHYLKYEPAERLFRQGEQALRQCLPAFGVCRYFTRYDLVLLLNYGFLKIHNDLYVWFVGGQLRALGLWTNHPEYAHFANLWDVPQRFPAIWRKGFVFCVRKLSKILGSNIRFLFPAQCANNFLDQLPGSCK